MAKLSNLDDAKKLLNKRKPKAENENKFEWLDKRLFDAQATPPPPTPLINIQGKTILTNGNYITISGKPKAGKSAFISGIVAAAISGQNVLGINCHLTPERPNIIHLDTEQGEYEYYQSINMVKKLAAINQVPGNFISYRLRGCKAENIRDAIIHKANDSKTGLIIIDGLLDTIIDFNDIHECRMITDILRDTTEQMKIGIICIIHQSKSTNYTIGHLGSFADRYSQSIIEVVKDNKNQISTLKPVFLRSAGNFDDVNIAFDLNQEMWKLSHHAPEEHKSSGKEITDEQLVDFANYLFADRNYVIYKQIQDDAKSFLKVSTKKVSEINERLMALNIIYKDGNNYFKKQLPF